MTGSSHVTVPFPPGAARPGGPHLLRIRLELHIIAAAGRSPVFPRRHNNGRLTLGANINGKESVQQRVSKNPPAVIAANCEMARGSAASTARCSAGTLLDTRQARRGSRRATLAGGGERGAGAVAVCFISGEKCLMGARG